MGNICRSPTAEGVFSRLIQEQGFAGRIEVDSAGTHEYHVGEPPDRRAQASAMKRGIDLSVQRARRVEKNDFERFDYVLAMDEDNYGCLVALCPEVHQAKLKLLMDYAPGLKQTEVPDPYYGGNNGFERVLDMVEHAAQGLLADIRKRYL
jgi:protein-tyrosine phosphatase